MTKLISTKQLMYCVAAFIIASSLLTKSLYTYTKNQTWICVILGAAFSFCIILMYGRLAKNHPGISLIEINEEVFGAVLGKLVSALYVFFFLTLTFFNSQDLGIFVKAFILPATPITLVYICFLLICAYAVRKGAAVITRYGAVITFCYIIIIIGNGLLMVNEIHTDNFMPVFTIPLKNFLLGAHLVTMLPFCEILAFMMFAQYLQNPVEIGKALRRGLLIGSLVLLFIIIRDIGVLGHMANTFSMPTYSSVRLINIGDILTRLDIIYAVTIITMLFFKVSILFFASVTSVAKLFKIENHKIFIFIIGTLAVVYSNEIFHSTSEHSKWFEAAATYSTFFLFVLPAVTFIISEIKKHTKKDTPDPEPQQ